MGIIDGTPLQWQRIQQREQAQLRQEADVIFSSVFLGFLEDGLGKGVALRWDVEPVADAASAEAKAAEREQQQMRAVLARLVQLTGSHADVTVGSSPGYDAKTLQIGIAATRGTQRDVRPIAWNEGVATRIRNVIRQRTTDCPRCRFPVPDDSLASLNLDQEFGAYYGIVDHPANSNPLLVSSVRRLIEGDQEGGRWLSDESYQGLIYNKATGPASALKQAGSIEPTDLIQRWGAERRDQVCGYCHGMVWAIAQVACNFPDGHAYELGLGRNTHKLASCFGCSTFLFANGYVPSSMHLGRSESWVPLPEQADAPALFNIGSDGLATAQGPTADHHQRFLALNAAWAQAVARWMVTGARQLARAEPGKAVEKWVRPQAELLLAQIEQRRQHHRQARERAERAVANLFLDALTVHDKDLLRLSRVVVPPPVATA
ncbi:hypothetical protein [Stenotrophomonas sp. 24(2023)]|uniref:hypothetical protein n=1 Tax=Stenotrophomonas sp. 24(2023) TaxID=3068324 RepID=UPI0027E1B5DD|nr:hypothetical protein [Stenotrophomonas sp. 24(2023)]WMJ70865.1 hypothetical protein Q9R17_07145 [Stenotrophomonas sp. 24(2023)]